MISWITPVIAIGEFADAMNLDVIKHEKIGTILFLDTEEKYWKICKVMKNNYVRVIHSPVVVDYDKEKDITWIAEKFAFSGEFNIEMMQMLELASCRLSSIQFGSNYRERTLVCCIAGIDRSPFVVAKYLVQKIYTEGNDDKNGNYIVSVIRNMSDAFAFVKKKRPCVVEHYEWLNEYEK